MSQPICYKKNTLHCSIWRILRFDFIVYLNTESCKVENFSNSTVHIPSFRFRSESSLARICRIRNIQDVAYTRFHMKVSTKTKAKLCHSSSTFSPKVTGNQTQKFVCRPGIKYLQNKLSQFQITVITVSLIFSFICHCILCLDRC